MGTSPSIAIGGVWARNYKVIPSILMASIITSLPATLKFVFFSPDLSA